MDRETMRLLRATRKVEPRRSLGKPRTTWELRQSNTLPGGNPIGEAVRKPLVWSYGITTVPERRIDLFPRTLESLKKAGFDRPRLFIDGAPDDREYKEFGLETTTRWPKIKTWGNWFLTLMELYIREPEADRYAIFQDDFVTYIGLREYLERQCYPEKGYWNLYTFPSNQTLCPHGHMGWYKSNQWGRGAVGLVFNRETVTNLLLAKHNVMKAQAADRRHKSVDGAVNESLKQIGYTEYVHNPSLVQHTGLVSSMGNLQHKLAESFRGEDYDIRSILKSKDNE